VRDLSYVRCERESPHLIFFLQGRLFIPSVKKNLKWGFSQNQTKLLLCLQKQYVHSRFELHEFFCCQFYILVFILWYTKGRKLENRLQ
jgi:hypothetical protein